MAEATTSRHESNYIKIAMVVLRVSPRAVRVQFDKEFRPDRLQSTLNTNIHDLTNLKMKKRITQPQWNLLFPRTREKPSSKDFDITLMLCLLRNLIPIDIMDNRLPPATDTSLRADLSRIKYCRNDIVHFSDALVDDRDFKYYWNALIPAILRLGGNSLKVECDDWHGRNFNAKQREDGLKYIKDEKRLALVEEELAEMNKKFIKLEQEQSKELAETKKKLIGLEQEQSKEVAETNKKLTELEQEQSKELAETKKKVIKLEQEQSKKLAETKKKLTELEQEQSKELEETKKKVIKLEQEQSKMNKKWIEFEEEKSKELAETKKKLIELEQEQSNPVPKNMREEIESWKKENFFETSAVATILKEVRNKSFVVVTGPSGIGKSTIAKLVALQLHRTDDYHIFPVMCPEDIVKYLDPNIKQIYIIDDICGKFSVDQSMINSWERVNSKILKYKDNKKFRILGTCRLQITVSSPFRKLQEQFEMAECNLLQENFLYSKEDKLKIAARHIDEETIKQLDDKIVSSHSMFPLLCKMYATLESKPGVRFFEYPIQVIKEELDKMSEQNECCFIGLALIIIYSNKLYKHFLQNRNEKKFKVVFDDVFEDLGLVNRPSKRSVLFGLQTLEGNYTKELESTITVIHDKIFDILSLYFGNRIPQTILTHGSGTFIAERFLFESVKEDCDELKIVIPSDLEDSYFNRMVEEIENNRFYNVFKNVQVRNELYQGKFISFLSKNQSIIQKLLYNQWPLYLSAVKGCKILVQYILSEKRTSGMSNKQDKDGNQDMLMDKPESDMYDCSFDSDSEGKSGSEYSFYKRSMFYFIDNDDCTTEEDAYRIQFENSPMVAACEGGYIDIVECLVEYGYNVDHSDVNLPAPLISACKYGNKDVVDFLLKRNCKVDAINEFGWTALHAACKNGHIDIVNILLKYSSSNVDLCDTYGYTPLHLACLYGHIDIVNILLKYSSNSVNLCGTNGDTPLHLACYNGNIDVVNILLKYDSSSVNLCDTNGFTPLHNACIYGHIDVVNILLKYSISMDLCGIDGYTPLHRACYNGHIDIVNVLLKYDSSSVNLCDTNGYTPLHAACCNGHIDIVNILLKHSSSVNQCSTNGFTPLHIACYNGNIGIVNILLKYDSSSVNLCDTDGDTPLHLACMKGHIDVVNILLKYSSSVNLCNTNGDTPLHVACYTDHIDIVNILLKYDSSSVNLCDTDGYTPLHRACIKGHIDVVNILLKYDSSSVNLCDTDGYTPLHRACIKGHIDVVNILLKYSSSVNLCDTYGFTPLHRACIKGHIDVVNSLLKYSSSVNQCSTDGYTPLHVACYNGHIDVVNILLKYSSSVNLCDTYGFTPLHRACIKGHIDIVNSLLKYSSSMDLCNTDGDTPFHLACRHGHIDIVKIFIKHNFDINLCGGLHGLTPMQYACLKGRTDIVKLLLGNNCDLIDNNGFSPALHSACEGGSVDIVDLLIRNKCNINQCQPRTNKSPLIVACDRNKEAIVKLLLSYEACDVNIIDCFNFNALHYACRNGQADVVELLLKRHCNINQCSRWMNTPLILAVQGQHTEVVEMLLKNKCDIDIYKRNGRTSLDIAVEKHFVDIEGILLNVIENTNAHDACTE